MSTPRVTAKEFQKAAADGTLHMLGARPVKLREPVGIFCDQCGEPWGAYSACGPTHAAVHAALTPKPKRAQPERELQRAIAKYLDSLGVLWFHPRNEGANRVERMRLSGEGVKAGVPDIVIFRAGVAWCHQLEVYAFRVPLWIEVKAPGGHLSLAQTGWRDKLKELGHEWHLVRSVEEVRAIMEGR